jgi:hypothetical protein
MGRRGPKPLEVCSNGHRRTPETTYRALRSNGFLQERCRLCMIGTLRSLRPVSDRFVDDVFRFVGRRVPKRPIDIHRDCADDVGSVSIRQVQRALAELRKRGLVRRVGNLDRFGRALAPSTSGYVRTSSYQPG